MSEKDTISIVLYGNMGSTSREWLKWYEYVLLECNKLGFKINYIGISGQSFNTGKINVINRVSKKLQEAFRKDETFNSIEFYSLPEGFKQAAFDYDIYFSRTSQGKHPHIVFTVPTDYYFKINLNDITSNLKEHIQFTSGQVFEMSSYESPQFYAAKANSPQTYKSLRVIQELVV